MFVDNNMRKINKNLNLLKNLVPVIFLLVFFLSLKTDANAQVNVNFGISNLQPWIQTEDSDIRIESSDSVIDPGGGGGMGTTFTNPLPGSPSDSPAEYCGLDPNASNAYTSLQGSSGTGTPGIIFTGTNDYSFGAGLASKSPPDAPYGWVVGGSLANDYNTQLTKKACYDFIYAKAIQGGLTPIDITADITTGIPVNHCGATLDDCKLDNLSHGLYIANGPMHLTNNSDYTFGLNQNYVILVNGSLTISNKIKVPVGSTAVFVVNGDITVSGTVGEVDYTSNNTDLEGIYSATGSFIIDSDPANTCPTPDLRLNLAGNIVTGAGGVGGSFINRRDLCDGNATCPVFFITGRPDFILNLPTLIRYTNYTWQEVAP